MDLKTYTKESARTAKDTAEDVYPRVKNVEIDQGVEICTLTQQRSIDILHGILGMAGEMGELSRAKQDGKVHEIVEEVGDFVWYGAVVARAMNWQMDRYLSKELLDNNFYALTLEQGVGKLAELLKKWLMYGKPINEKLLMDGWYEAMGAAINTIGDWEGFEQDVLEMNIQKLRKRYPDKFTEEAAIARADKAD